MRQKDWPRAVSAWDACIGANDGREVSPAWHYARGTALIYSERFAEAEGEFSALASQHPDLPYGPMGLARLAYAQQHWQEALPLWEDCIAKFPTHSERAAWERTRASLLERLERWPAALEAWQQLASSHPDVHAISGTVRCAVRVLGPTEETDAIIARAVAEFPAEPSFQKLYARNAQLRRDNKVALERWQAYVERFPDDLSGYESALATARQIGSAGIAPKIVVRAPATLSETRQFQYRVVLPLCALEHNIGRGMAIVRAADPVGLELADAACIAQFLIDTLHYADAAPFLTAMLERFPGRRNLVQPYLIATLHSQGPATFQLEKARLFSDLTEADQIGIVRSLPRNHLSGAELRRLIDHVLASEPDGPLRTRELTTILESNSIETAEYLQKRLGASHHADERILGRLIFARLRDMQRLSRANLGGASWQEFETEAASVWKDVREEARGSLAVVDSPLRRNMALLGGAAGRRSRAWLNTAESYFDAASFAHWFCERVRRGEPTSVIRLGDGEGNFLPYPPDERRFKRSDQSEIQRKSWWGDELLSKAECDRLSGSLLRAIARADALGLPPPGRLLRNADGSQRSSRGVRAILSLFDRKEPPVKRGIVLTSCHIHTDLDNWDLYRQIFRHVEQVSVVSCHDLSATLAEQFGIGVRRWHRMPPEKKFEGMFEYSGREAVSPVAAFENIMADIDPLPGELVLVAAGFLGKLMCEQVRARGGIALDIGSAADYWMGFQTRAYGRNQTIFDPSSSLIEGQPFADVFGTKNISDARPCHSDLGRDKNLTGLFARSVVQSPEPVMQTYPVRLVGHPRCGSKYVSQALQHVGLHVGHERLGEHGICSWMHAVEDESLPYAAPYVPLDSFQLTALYMRNPADAIPSIMLENTRSRSFDFRRFHIFRLLGFDIAKSRDPLERAIQSYVGWTKVIEQQSPVMTLRVEHLAEDLQRLLPALRSAGVALSESDFALIDDVPTDVNRSTEKFALPKPSLRKSAYRRVSRELRRELDGICRKYCYPSPLI